MQPPCIAVDTITAGNATVGRLSTAHASEHGTASLEGIARSLRGLLGALLELRLDLGLAGLVEAAVGPVAVRAEHTGQLVAGLLRPIQVAGDVVAGIAGEEDLLDR